MNPIVRCILTLMVLGFNLIGLCYGQAQGTQTEFGKNRVQFKEFQWFYYHSPHFDTYYYKEGKEEGEYKWWNSAFLADVLHVSPACKPVRYKDKCLFSMYLLPFLW